jgi:hypothetical protein
MAVAELNAACRIVLAQELPKGGAALLWWPEPEILALVAEEVEGEEG